MSQSERLLDLLSDCEGHRTDEIMEKVYGGSHLGLCRIGARVHDLKRKGYEISGWKDAQNPSLYWYRLESVPVKNPTSPLLVGEKPSLTQASFFDGQEIILNGRAYYHNTSSMGK